MPTTFSIAHGASLTTTNVLVTCDKTYRTALLDNNCGLRNFYCAVLPGTFHIKRNRFWKLESFDHKYGRRLHERTRPGPAGVSLFPLLILLPWGTSASRELRLHTKNTPTCCNSPHLYIVSQWNRTKRFEQLLAIKRIVQITRISLCQTVFVY